MRGSDQFNELKLYRTFSSMAKAIEKSSESILTRPRNGSIRSFFIFLFMSCQKTWLWRVFTPCWIENLLQNCSHSAHSCVGIWVRADLSLYVVCMAGACACAPERWLHVTPLAGGFLSTPLPSRSVSPTLKPAVLWEAVWASSSLNADECLHR